MDAIVENFPRFVDAFLVTLRLLAISGAGALVLGTIIAALRISPVAALRGFATVYTEVLRNTPLTLVLFFCASVLPRLEVRLEYTVAAIIGLTLYTSPFVAEAIRSGVNGVAVGQAEAARAIGLRFGQTVGLIVLPQAIRMVIPPLINVLIALTKNTSVAAGFSVGAGGGSGRFLTMTTRASPWGVGMTTRINLSWVLRATEVESSRCH